MLIMMPDADTTTTEQVHARPQGRGRWQPGRRSFFALGVVLALLVGSGAYLVLRGEPALETGDLWTTPLEDDARVSPDSADAVGRLARQARYTPTSSPVSGYNEEGYQAIVQIGEYSVPVWTVEEDQPTSVVTLVDSEGQPRPEGDSFGLQDTWREVPVPDVDQPQAEGDDGHLVIWQPSTDTLWEFWRFESRGTGGDRTYAAEYGARIDDQSDFDGRIPNRWGARATSLELLGGVLRMDEYLEGAFPHAVGVALPVVDEVVVPPASRTDGPVSATPEAKFDDALSEGMRFRLPAGYDCAGAFPESERFSVMLCEAVRDYGLIVNDRTGGSVSLFAEDDRTVGTTYSELEESPWPGAGVAFSGPDALLNRFPWDDLQLLEPLEQPLPAP